MDVDIGIAERPADVTSGGGASRGDTAAFRPDIEGLRAVAIGLVVLYHAGWAHAAGGYLGVDVFFVLSGFLITGLLGREAESTGTVSLVGFWARRARRLLPATFVVTVAILFAGALLSTPFEQIDHAESARAFAVYASNILFAIKSTVYFGDVAVHDPMLHTWSLSVEEQFYLFFAPMVAALAASAAASRPMAFQRRFIGAALVVSAASVAGCLWVAAKYPVVGFFILPTRAWEFGIGALSAYAVRKVGRLNAWPAEGLAWAAVIGLVGSGALAKNGVVQPLGLVTVVPTLSTAALILTGALARPTSVRSLLALPPMRLLGRLSYSWYLWHWPVLVFLRDVVDKPSLRLSVGVAFLSLLPAAATYRWVESPIRFSRALQRRARGTLIGAVALAALTLSMAGVALLHADRILATPAYAPIVAGRAFPSVYANGCHLTIPERAIPPCVFGPGTTDSTVVLFGDSHAAMWFPALDSVVKLRGWRLISLTKSACPSVSVEIVNAQLGRRYTECEEWRSAAIARILASRPTVIVVANTRAYEVLAGGAVLRTDIAGPGQREWGEGLSRTLTALARSGAPVMVIENNVHPGFDPSTCLSRNLEHPERCVATLRAVDTIVVPAERQAVLANPSASYVSLNDVICDGPRCLAMRDGVVRYQDSNHISVQLAASLAPEMSRLLTQVLTEHNR